MDTTPNQFVAKKRGRSADSSDSSIANSSKRAATAIKQEGDAVAAATAAGAGAAAGLQRAQSLQRFAAEGNGLLMRLLPITDAVHGSLMMEVPLMAIINTPQFNRLGELAQLGTSEWVYRCATHTRWAHSVGVAHLAGRMVMTFMLNQNEHLRITKEDLLCVKIAGLCHDLGHGPYSHVWDNSFMKRVGRGDWTHEMGSVLMLKHLLKANKIDLGDWGLSPTDVLFIEEMILGTPPNERKGRPKEKGFLYDVVNNTRSGLDVDKLDYFVRDAREAGVGQAPDIGRFFDHARVCWARDGQGEVHRMICYPKKMACEISEVFRFRMTLHRKIYQHHSTKAHELMLVDALCLAEPHFHLLSVTDDKHPAGEWRLSEAVDNMAVFSDLTDSVVAMIANAPGQDMAPARALISRWRRRDLYKLAFDTNWRKQPGGGKGTIDMAALQAELRAAAADWVERHKRRAGGTGRCSPVPEHAPSSQASANGNGNTSKNQPDGDETEPDDSDHEQVCALGVGGLRAATAAGGGGDKAAASQQLLEQVQELGPDDILLDMCYIHCGQGDQDPTAKMRFYNKWDRSVDDSSQTPLGQPVEEFYYENALPRHLSTQHLRAFVRDARKATAAQQVCEYWWTRRVAGQTTAGANGGASSTADAATNGTA